MRPLTVRMAQRCEDAQTIRCRCRCNGACHGAHRGWVGTLPDFDPHRPAQAWVQLQLPLPVSCLRRVS